MAVLQQMTLFKERRAATKPRKSQATAKGPAALARGEFEPVNPPNLAQTTALWLCGQRSIALQRGKRYVRESMKHPGKMQPYVAGAIFDTYISPGSFVVDAMGGIATTNVEGMERGHTVVCVELVRRWAEVAAQNVELTRRRGAPGKGAVIWGDARALPELLQQLVDATVMSPPFGDSNVRQMPSDFGESGPGGHFSDPHRGYDAALLSPPFGEGRESGKAPGPAEPRAGEWSEYENGDGRLPVERGIGIAYDAMIASPAYGDIRQDGGDHQFGGNSAMELHR